MNVLGNKIREERESKQISQQDLVKDICRENVLKMIETKNRCDSKIVFHAICNRLGLKVDECIEYTDEEKLSLLLDKIEVKCNIFEHKEAYEIICAYELGEVQQNILLMSQYYYYIGITALVGAKNLSLALSYLNKGLEYGDNVNIYSILSVNGLGGVYEEKGDLEEAKIYHEQSLRLVKNYVGNDVSVKYKIYFNSARFYSEVKEYQRAIEICEEAISLNEEKGTFHHLEILYYELGFNKHMIGESAVIEYKMAYYLAKHLKNKHVINVILDDAKRYNLSFQVDEDGVI
ncbi:tetratricopeptide repeat protein [Enterococcus rivorum]|uniref:HTH cro/C1-type domain-containing protein n=1 Tax=Enterococcus rivorum TaxID=762845 RepID=A0A1E5KZ10_9ENTE|nr:tetratricopeptide repeat protein [Enterococcus rivorum]MBP2097685.1 tetratricopeptide (TPR) repeat protein [Enterococcus rivorum]OEH83121.1 hypothetical protein BCR26_02305 [Enterococcus rivorum]